MTTTNQTSAHAIAGFTGETPPNPKHEAAIKAIKDSQAKQGSANLDTAELIAKTLERYRVLQGTLADRLGMSKSELNKYVSIGNRKVLYTSEVRPLLPHGFSLLHILSLVPHLDEAMKHGRINPDMTRKQCEDLREIFARRYLPDETPPLNAPSKEKREKQTKVGALPTDICAMIKMTANFELQKLVQERMAELRSRGLVVYDMWTVTPPEIEDATPEIVVATDAPALAVFPQPEGQSEASILDMLDATTEATPEVETNA